MMYYKKVYQERRGDNHHKTEGFLNGSKWFCGEGGGGSQGIKHKKKNS